MKCTWFSAFRLATALPLAAACFVLPAQAVDKIPPNQAALAEVAAGTCREAHAAWWGFDPADATAALQAAIRSGVRKIIVENLGTPWVVDKLQLAGGQEIVFEPGVVVQAKRGAFHGTGDSLFSATLQTNITLTGFGGLQFGANLTLDSNRSIYIANSGGTLDAVAGVNR